MRKLVTAFIVVPLIIIFVTFAVANRELVTISFDPFDSAQPAYAFKVQLFLLIFALLAIGLLFGSLVTWINQRKWRSRARKSEQEVRALRAELSSRTSTPEASQSAQQTSPLYFPPAA